MGDHRDVSKGTPEFWLGAWAAGGLGSHVCVPLCILLARESLQCVFLRPHIPAYVHAGHGADGANSNFPTAYMFIYVFIC